jgi:hypothetical protein
MNASHGAPAALGFILAIPLFALPALGAPRTTRDISRRIIGSRISPTLEPMSARRRPSRRHQRPTASAARMRNATSGASTISGPKPAARLEP